MELASLLWLCFTSFLAFFSWHFYFSGFFYYVKWFAIYIVLWWKKFKQEKPNVPIFATREEECMEKPKIWTQEKQFRQDSMSLYAVGPQALLMLQIVRGRYNSAASRVYLQLGSRTDTTYLATESDVPRACEGWVTDCLALQCLEPMRRWRLVYSGRLHYRSKNGRTATKLVRINLIWAALSGPYHYQADGHPGSVSSALAARPLSHLRHSLDSLGEGYEQWGMVQGTVTVDESVTNLHCGCLRQHCWGERAALGVVGVTEGGLLFSINYTFSSIKSQLGHIRYADGRVEPLFGNSASDSAAVGVRFVRSFETSCYYHLVYVVRSPWRQWGGLRWAAGRGVMDNRPATFLVTSWDRRVREVLPVLPLQAWSSAGGSYEMTSVAVSLCDPSCADPSLVGGKAASLALLTDTANTALRHKVVVPPGFCLTVVAMQLQAQSSETLLSAVKYLTLTGPSNLQAESQHVVSAWLTVPMCSPVLAAISERIDPNRSYAVRSSAVGEDGADVSAAGQNTTVLVCVGLESVVAAVHKCWASLYSYRSVEYRRQAGLAVQSLMGVVVQEVVTAEVAGIMFTRHPVTADPHRLLITANYGLGETVVSSSVEPDSLLVDTEDPKHPVVKSVVRGSKDHIVTIKDGVLTTEKLGSELTESVCLSEPQIIALARVGIRLERMFGWPKDVEWAIHKGVIYLLQCRPITSLLAWSQDELTHELDSAILPDDALTTANTGEVFPGATSPLCQSTALRCADFVMIPKFAGVHDKLWYANSKLITSQHCTFLSLYNTLLLGASEEASLQQRVLELAICGHQVSSPALQRTAASRTTPLTLTQRLQTAAFFLKQLLVSKLLTSRAQKIGEEFEVKYDTFTTAEALYAYLTARYLELIEVFRLHTRVSLASTIWQTILFSVLAEGNRELSEENVEDIAQLLVGKHAAVSAQIPADITELTKVIKTCEHWPEVTRMASQKVSGWLERNCPEAATLLAGIVERYQHRHIKELDVMTSTWGLDSSPLVAMVQTTLRSSEHNRITREQRADTHTPVRDKLKSPKKPFTKWLLGWMVGVSQSAAGRREVTKDASLRVLHQLRMGYRQLAQLMVAEGRLPSAQLVFYCTHYELGLLLRHPNPPLVHKISRRKRNWLQWDQLRFPEVSTGLPTPVQVDSHTAMDKCESVQGTLVCAGSVRGRACVLHSCVRTQSLQPGDILVTHSTDVGWTPLFPSLAGVVTELGGLISHGAVVAREYGLPCVVGATNATSVFKTGDEIYLDGKSGKVQKISSIA